MFTKQNLLTTAAMTVLLAISGQADAGGGHGGGMGGGGSFHAPMSGNSMSFKQNIQPVHNNVQTVHNNVLSNQSNVLKLQNNHINTGINGGINNKVTQVHNQQVLSNLNHTKIANVNPSNLHKPISLNNLSSGGMMNKGMNYNNKCVFPSCGKYTGCWGNYSCWPYYNGCYNSCCNWGYSCYYPCSYLSCGYGCGTWGYTCGYYPRYYTCFSYPVVQPIPVCSVAYTTVTPVVTTVPVTTTVTTAAVTSGLPLNSVATPIAGGLALNDTAIPPSPVP